MDLREGFLESKSTSVESYNGTRSATRSECNDNIPSSSSAKNVRNKRRKLGLTATPLKGMGN